MLFSFAALYDKKPGRNIRAQQISRQFKFIYLHRGSLVFLITV